MPKGPGTLVDSGFVDVEGKITPLAKAEFVRQVKEELKNGSGGASFPCGLEVAPDPGFDLQLENEELFPDFHQKAFKNYEQIASVLNVQGNFSLLPICDPLALGFKIKPDLKLDIDFPSGEFIEYALPNLPALAVKLEFDIPIDLGLKFPTLIAPVPKLEIPELVLPDPLQFPELYKFNLPALNIPNVFPDIIVKIPTFALKIASLDIPSVFKEICKTINKNLFPPPNLPAGDPSPISDFAISIATANVTSRMTTAMVTATAVGVTMGSSPDGLVGAIGIEAKVKEPAPKEKTAFPNVRDKIVSKALRAISTSHGGKRNGTSLSYYGDKEEYAKFLLYTECGDGSDKSILPKDDPNYDLRVIGVKRASASQNLTYSSCGMFARACYWSAGASVSIKGNEFGTTGQKMYREVDGTKYYYNFFTDEYRGFDLPAIEAMARKLGAIKYESKSFGQGLENVKRGDLFYIRTIGDPASNHICIAISDWDGQSVQTVEGGQAAPLEAGYSAVPKGQPNYMSIRRFKYYDKSSYTGQKAGDSKDNEFGTHRQVNFKNGKSYSLGISGKSYVALVIDAELFVNNKSFAMAKNPKFQINDINLAISDENANQGVIESLQAV